MPHQGSIAKCPYYARENQVTIFCESAMPACEDGKNGYHAQIFSNAREKRQYMKQHCARYPMMDCTYASYMNQCYEGRKQDENQDKAKKGVAADRKPKANHFGA